MKGISLSIPLQYDQEFGPFKMTKDIPSTVKNNLKNLLLCAPGEKVMDINFGVGLRTYLFENSTEKVKEEISQRVYSNVQKYMPFVSIKAIDIDAELLDNHKLYVKISYYVPSLNVEDFIEESLTKN